MGLIMDQCREIADQLQQGGSRQEYHIFFQLIEARQSNELKSGRAQVIPMIAG